MHFLGLALLIVAAVEIRNRVGKPTIVIDRERIEAMLPGGEDTRLDRTRVERAVREAVHDEILYHEALRRGLAARDEIRTTLIQVMRATVDPIIPEPTDDALARYRETVPEAFRFPPRVAFEHVSFRSLDDIPSDTLLERLRHGEDPTGLGQPVRLANPFPSTYRPQIERVLGAPFAARVFELPPGQWHGPIPSNRGVHFIRVTERSEAEDIPFEQARPILRENWIRREKERELNRTIREMAEAYHIRLPRELQSAWPP